jgi:hypothetical protein
MDPYIDVVNKIINTDFNNNNNSKNNELIYQNNIIVLFLTFLRDNYRNIPLKWKYVKNILNNIFISKDHKDIFINTFGKIQKIFLSLNKFLYIYKFNKSKIVIDEDLYLNKINIHDKNTICIYQHNSRYLFVISDIINIINTALKNSSNFFSNPLSIKNPYSNLYFNKSTLYNIYFKIKHYNCLVPDLIHRFFLVNFNLKNFEELNECLLREYAIRNFIDNHSNMSSVYDDIFNMINSVFLYTKKKINIHPEFPKKELISIMKPYLCLYYESMYSLTVTKKYTARVTLTNKLRNFYDYNPLFGRKKMEILYKNKKTETVFHFDKVHVNFTLHENDFINNHLHISPIYPVHVIPRLDEDEEEDDGDDQEEEEEFDD